MFFELQKMAQSLPTLNCGGQHSRIQWLSSSRCEYLRLLKGFLLRRNHGSNAQCIQICFCWSGAADWFEGPSLEDRALPETQQHRSALSLALEATTVLSWARHAMGYDEHTTLSASSWEKVVAKDEKKGSSKGKQNKVLAG